MFLKKVILPNISELFRAYRAHPTSHVILRISAETMLSHALFLYTLFPFRFCVQRKAP